MEPNSLKFQSYVKYAVGEIFLIVIGILIAIEVNNWNEAKAQDSEQLQIIENLVEVVRDDQRRIESVIQNFSRTVEIINQMNEATTAFSISSNASSEWVRVVFWSNPTSAVYSNYNNSSINIVDPALSTALSGYISIVDSVEGTLTDFLLPAVQEIRHTMDEFIVREFSSSTEQLEPDINAQRFIEEYNTNSELQESLYRLYLLSRTLVSQYEYLESVRFELESLADSKIEELSGS